MALTNTAIRNFKPKERAYKVSDAEGLYLQITPKGGKLWRLKYRYNGIERKLSLGAYPEITLAEARALRLEARKQLAHGIDPSAAKRQAKIDAAIRAENTFAAIANEVIAKQEKEGKAPRTINKLRWLLKLLSQDFACRPVAEITPQELLCELRKQERRGKLETTRRLRSFSSRIFRYAVATARAEHDPAQMLQGALISPPANHFAAITDPKEFGKLLRAIDGYEGEISVVYALRLTPHLFQRPGEIRRMEWSEVDFEKAIWTIPAEKMKMRTPHAVPLSRQALSLLKEIQELSVGSSYVFPSLRTPSRPISDNTINAALRRLGYTSDQMTAHGFRTSASSLLNESGKWNPDAIERSLAHMVSGEIRRIYNRSTYWPERVEMAQWWSDYIEELKGKLPD